jgi:hypothetical protein
MSHELIPKLSEDKNPWSGLLLPHNRQRVRAEMTKNRMVMVKILINSLAIDKTSSYFL